MDWWRAKLILIGAFLCLDLFLARQVWRLRGFSGPGAAVSAAPSLSGSNAMPNGLPELNVRTLGWQESWLSALVDPVCNPKDAGGLAGRATSPSIQCTSPVDGAQLNWYNGLLIYSNDHPYRTMAAAEDEARQVIGAIDPKVLASGELSQVSLDPGGQTRTFTLVERYDNDLPLFNGRWTIIVGPHGIQAERWWVQVQARVNQLPPQPLISPTQAIAAVAALYGQQAVSTEPAELGYYNPHPQPPALATLTSATAGQSGIGAQGPVWYVKPVYIVHVEQAACVYVDAWGGDPVDDMHSDC